VLEAQGKTLLAELGVRVTSEHEVSSLDAALDATGKIGYPVIIKVLSDASTHRAGTGLVSKRIDNPGALRDAWDALQAAAAQHLPADARWSVLISEFVVGNIEAYVGVIRDPEWGPMVSLGIGGAWIEEIGDAALVPAPTNPEEVRAALTRSRLSGVLRRAHVAEDAVSEFVGIAVSVGDLVAAQPRISELDLNPVIFDARSPVVVDALIVLS
jgi:acetyl-CoA synthetase